MLLLDPGRRLEAAQVRHDHVHEDDIGSEPVCLGDRALAVLGFAHDLDSRLAAQQGSHALPQDAVVVHQEDADRRGVAAVVRHSQSPSVGG